MGNPDDKGPGLGAQPTLPYDMAASPTFDARSSGESATLAAGAVLAERYEIVRFLGEGGMGKVYEAKDREVGGVVALKTLRVEAASAALVDRLRREIQLARKITHANVCRLFDIGFHRPSGPAGETARETAFLTMELLAGETLLRRVMRAPLSTSEARPIVEQIVAALRAAHRAGVVHRDLKSDNVFLVPDAEAAGQTRVVVTDFGLAREVDPNAARVTGAGEMIGSPAYMAPEQVEGTRAGPAADIYALGVVMFEMVTGKLPFLGDSPLATALMRVRHDAPSAREHVPDLDPVWEAAIRRCLERAPERRFAAVEDVVRVLDGHSVSRPAPRRARTAMAAMVGAVALIAGGAWLGISRHAVGARAATKAPSRIAVLDIDGVPGREWASALATEELTRALDVELDVVPAAESAQARLDLGLASFTRCEPAVCARIAGRLGASILVSGGLTDVGGRSRVQLVAQSPAGDVIATGDATGTLAEAFDTAMTSLARALGATAPDASALHAPLELQRAHGNGLVRLRRNDYLGARIALETAIHSGSAAVGAHAALAETYEALAMGPEAARELEPVIAASRRRERAALVARRHAALREVDQALAALELPLILRPDTETAILYADIAANGGRRGLVDVMLSRLPPGAVDRKDPRLLSLEAQGWLRKDLQRSRALIDATIAEAERRGSERVRANALAFRGYMAIHDGTFDAALADLEKAQSSLARVGSRVDMLGVVNIQALVNAGAAHYQNAMQLFDEALALAAEVAPGEVHVVLENALFDSIAAGEITRARRLLDDLLRRAETDPEIASRVGPTLIQGWVLFDEGDLARAAPLLEASTAVVQAHQTQFQPLSVMRRAELLRERGDTDGAIKLYEVAVDLAERAGIDGMVIDAHVGLATLYLEQDRPAEAIAMAAGAETLAASSHRPDSLALARALRAAASFTRNDLVAARSFAADATTPVHDSLPVRLRVAAIRARIDPAARAELDAAIADAHKAGFVLGELEAQIAAARLDPSPAGRAALPRLAARARQLGSARLVASATEALSSGDGR